VLRIPGHKGIPLNENTGYIATLAVKDEVDENVKLFTEEDLKEIKTVLESRWTKEYRVQCVS